MLKFFYRLDGGPLTEYICEWETDISNHPDINEIVIEYILEALDEIGFFTEAVYADMPKLELFDKNKKSLGLFQTKVELLPSFYSERIDSGEE